MIFCGNTAGISLHTTFVLATPSPRRIAKSGSWPLCVHIAPSWRPLQPRRPAGALGALPLQCGASREQWRAPSRQQRAWL